MPLSEIGDKRDQDGERLVVGRRAHRLPDPGRHERLKRAHVVVRGVEFHRHLRGRSARHEGFGGHGAYGGFTLGAPNPGADESLAALQAVSTHGRFCHGGSWRMCWL
jgi:hypothetical protein